MSVQVDEYKPHLKYAAAAGETNRLKVTVDQGGYLANVWDAGALIRTGRNCYAVLLHAAKCIATGTQQAPGPQAFTATLGDRNDTLSLIRAPGNGEFSVVSVDAGPGNDSVSLAQAPVRYLSTTVGGDGNDALTGGTGLDVLFGGSGNDVLVGGDGNDELWGGPGAEVDRLSGGAGDDFLLLGAGPDDERGGPGKDLVSAAFGGVGAGPIFMSLDDVANDGHSGSGANLHSDIEDLVGSEYPNTLVGSALPNLLFGGGADDYLDGSGGADTLNGRQGDDTLIGGAGPDHLLGYLGDDVLYANDGEADTVDCSVGNDIAHVDALDTLIGCETALP